MNKTKKLVTLSLLLAIALVLSYLESFLPPLSVAVPGVKMGLANIAVIYTLYAFGGKEAAAVSLLRVFLSSLLFGSFTVFLYSAAGAAVSLLLMIFVKKTSFFGITGVSVLGGVAHNAAQIAVAAILFGSGYLFSYLPILTVSGTLAGVLVGIAGALLVQKVKPR